jgi:hypothetical protein
MGHSIKPWLVRNYNCDSTVLSLYYSLASMSLQLCCDAAQAATKIKSLETGTA